MGERARAGRETHFSGERPARARAVIHHRDCGHLINYPERRLARSNGFRLRRLPIARWPMNEEESQGTQDREESTECKPACPVCGGSLIEIRAKFQCSR